MDVLAREVAGDLAQAQRPVGAQQCLPFGRRHPAPDRRVFGDRKPRIVTLVAGRGQIGDRLVACERVLFCHPRHS